MIRVQILILQTDFFDKHINLLNQIILFHQPRKFLNSLCHLGLIALSDFYQCYLFYIFLIKRTHRVCAFYVLHQQFIRVPLAPHPNQHLLFLVFLILVLIVNVPRTDENKKIAIIQASSINTSPRAFATDTALFLTQYFFLFFQS